MFMNNHYNNQSNIKKVSCPVLLIHGKKDLIIPCDHSKSLYQALQKENNHKSKLITPEKMTHNDFDFEVDLMNPTSTFSKDLFEDAKL